MQSKDTRTPYIHLIPASKLHKYATKEKGIIRLKDGVIKGLEVLLKEKTDKVDRVIFVNDAFLNAYNSKATFRLSLGGYGSGKSYSKALEYLLLSMGYGNQGYFRALFLRKNKEDVRDSQFQLFKDIIDAYQLNEWFSIKETTMDITCKCTGYKLLAAGAYEVASLKSINDITHVWLEEPINKGRKNKRRRADISREDFETLNIRVRTEKADLHMDLTFNPISKSTWIYEDFFDEKKKKYKVTNDPNATEEAFVLKTNYLDNYFTSDKAKQDMARLTGNEAIVGRDGDWAMEKTGLEWLYRFDRAKHVGRVAYYKDLPIFASFDFNNLPYQTMMGIQVMRYFNEVKQKNILQIRVFREFCMAPPFNHPKHAINTLEAEYIKRYGYNVVSVFGDCSGKYGVNNYLDIFDKLKKYLPSDGNQVGEANPHRHTIREIDIEILIDKNNCPNLINDCENLQTDVKGYDPEKEDGIETKGHTYDTLAYFIAQYFEYLLKDR
jgi:PBSX family phage terminase large subunit